MFDYWINWFSSQTHEMAAALPRSVGSICGEWVSTSPARSEIVYTLNCEHLLLEAQS